MIPSRQDVTAMLTPSPQDIGNMFKKIGANGGGFLEFLDPNVKLEVMGHEHQHKNSHATHKELADDFFGQFEWMDWDSTKVDIRQVIGGLTPWVSVELVITGKSLKAKPFNHECVCIVHFNTAGKIDEARAYFDSAHLDDHYNHHRKN